MQLQQSFDFEQLYIRYPSKEGKGKGIEKLKKDIRTSEDLALFERAMSNYIEMCKSEKREIRFMMRWKTFCNNWRDYIDLVVHPGSNREMMDRIYKGEL